MFLKHKYTTNFPKAAFIYIRTKCICKNVSIPNTSVHATKTEKESKTCNNMHLLHMKRSGQLRNYEKLWRGMTPSAPIQTPLNKYSYYYHQIKSCWRSAKAEVNVRTLASMFCFATSVSCSKILISSSTSAVRLLAASTSVCLAAVNSAIAE